MDEKKIDKLKLNTQVLEMYAEKKNLPSLSFIEKK